MERRETPAAKRLRLAKQYLDKVRQNLDSEDEDALISERLKTDVLESAGKFFHQIAAQFEGVASETMLRTGRKCHQLSVTSIAVACTAGVDGDEGGEFVYSTSKDSSIVKWDFKTGDKLAYIPGGIKPTKRIKSRIQHESMLKHIGHSQEILTCAASTDGKFLVSERDIFAYIYLNPGGWVIAMWLLMSAADPQTMHSRLRALC
jgi:ribosomal RNA-processing protein 9